MERKIEVGTKEQLEKLAETRNVLTACQLVRMLAEPRVPAHVEYCAGCGEAIWVAETTPERSTKMCLPCAREEVKDQPTRPAYFIGTKAAESADMQKFRDIFNSIFTKGEKDD